MNSVETKWNKIYQNADFSIPAEVLSENRFLLPKTGRALDLACGLGENALLLAEHGLQTHAWDVSSIALERLHQKSLQDNHQLSTKQILIDKKSLSGCSFDVIVISRFLDRALCNEIIASLNPNGLLFYQTFVIDKVSPVGPNNPDYLLTRNELLQLFKDLVVVSYRENSRIGNLQLGNRNEACFVGQKP